MGQGLQRLVPAREHGVLEYALISRLASAGLVVAIILIGAVACADSGDAGSIRDTGTGSFRGPWADLFSSTYEEATDPAQREALADDVISDQEYAYFRQRIVDCLAGIGVEASWGDNNTLEYSRPSGVSNDQVTHCNEVGGLNIIALHDAITRNPENKDESEILVACLKRTHAVGPEYTADMLESGTDLQTFIETDKFEKCNADPLHHAAK